MATIALVLAAWCAVSVVVGLGLGALVRRNRPQRLPRVVEAEWRDAA